MNPLWMASVRRLLLSMTALCCGIGLVSCGNANNSQETGTFHLTLLHTNDLHSHLMGFDPTADYTPSADGDGTVGGFARIATKVKAIRLAAGDRPVLLVDSGDFMMGTAFSMLGLSQASELTEMGKLGYDAITFGNHEFDFGPEGLAGILQTATANGFDVPIVASNLQFAPGDTGSDDLQQFANNGLIQQTYVKTLPNGLKVGFFGLLGTAAQKVAPLAAPLTFADTVATAKAMVDKLRNQDHVDLVIALSHSGTDAQGKGEDAKLATKVPGIDVIVSGHTHVALPQPVVVGTTYIVQTGSYGRNLGDMDLTVTRSPTGTTIKVDSYELIPIDDSIQADSATQSDLDSDIDDIDSLLAPAGLAYDQLLAETSFDVPAIAFAESPMGDLVTDAYLAMTGIVTGTTPEIAVEVGGNIRDGLFVGKTGQIWFADLFRTEPLGIGPDGVPGYPLVTYYLTSADVKSGLELSAAAEDLFHDNDFFLQFSGMTVTIDSSKPVFSRVQSATLDGGGTIVSDGVTSSGCHEIVSTIYVAELLGLVESESGGALSVTAMSDPLCSKPVTDFTQEMVLTDPGATPPTELKQWQALTEYVLASPQNAGGIPVIDQKYAAPGGRLVTTP